jgi:hypothetical protein
MSQIHQLPGQKLFEQHRDHMRLKHYLPHAAGDEFIGSTLMD